MWLAICHPECLICPRLMCDWFCWPTQRMRHVPNLPSPRPDVRPLRNFWNRCNEMKFSGSIFPASLEYVRCACHAESIISEYRRMFPQAYDRENHRRAVPSSDVPHRLAQLRLDPDSDESSNPDEESSLAGSGRIGTGSPLQVEIRIQVSRHLRWISTSHPLDSGR